MWYLERSTHAEGGSLENQSPRHRDSCRLRSRVRRLLQLRLFTSGQRLRRTEQFVRRELRFRRQFVGQRRQGERRIVVLGGNPGERRQGWLRRKQRRHGGPERG